MATIRCQNLKWRDGRPRWEPGPAIRAIGFRGRDLKDDAGQWLGLADAIAAAEKLNCEVAEFRASGKKHYRPKREAPGRTCRALYLAWSAETNVRWQKLARSTRKEYRSKIEIFLDEGEFADAPVASLTKPILDAYWNHAFKTHGHAMANGIIAAVRAMLSHAERLGWLQPNANPARALQLPTVPPRLVVWTPAECERLVATADRIGLPHVGDAIVLALNTAQRQADVLALTMPEIVNGRARFQLEQGKTGARVSVPLTPQLEARLGDIRRRTHAGTVTTLHLSGPIVALTLPASSERPITEQRRDVFGPDWREVRRQAATGCAELGLAPMPAIAGKKFLDFRDTAITRLALAGCDFPQIKAISGHSYETITQVMRHYLMLDESMADAAIDKLRAWIEREGIAV